MIIAAAMLWTVMYAGTETTLQFGTEKDCVQALDHLPFLHVPPRDQMSCEQRPDHNPVIHCGDGSVAYIKSNERCKRCIEKSGHLVTSVMCEGNGYEPETAADKD